MRRRLLEALVWSALAYGIWLVSLSAVSAQEYVVGSLCALPCGAAAAGARWAVEGSWTLRPAWLLPLLALPVVIVSDAVQVLAAPWRRPQGRGRFETVPTAAAGGSVAGESRRAVATALVSSTPGSYVLDVDPETGDMLVHRLASRGPRIDHLVTS